MTRQDSSTYRGPTINTWISIWSSPKLSLTTIRFTISSMHTRALQVCCDE